MQLEEGKFYKTRDGRKRGPLRLIPDAPTTYRWCDPGGFQWKADGSCSAFGAHPLDLVEEWVDEPAQTGPVRERIVREIVPGGYGRIGVGVVEGERVRVGILGHMAEYATLSSEELRSAAMVFSQLAEALDSRT